MEHSAPPGDFGGVGVSEFCGDTRTYGIILPMHTTMQPLSREATYQGGASKRLHPPVSSRDSPSESDVKPNYDQQQTDQTNANEACNPPQD